MIKGLPDVDLILVRVKCDEESEILDYLANLDVRWSRSQLANEWRLKKEDMDSDEYYLIILNGRKLSWGEVKEIDSPIWDSFVDMKNIRSEERLEAEEFIERFIK